MKKKQTKLCCSKKKKLFLFPKRNDVSAIERFLLPPLVASRLAFHDYLLKSQLRPESNRPAVKEKKLWNNI